MSLTLTIGTLRDGNAAIAFGFRGLTLFVETPWFDASIGRRGPDLLVHR